MATCWKAPVILLFLDGMVEGVGIELGKVVCREAMEIYDVWEAAKLEPSFVVENPQDFAYYNRVRESRTSTSSSQSETTRAPINAEITGIKDVFAEINVGKSVGVTIGMDFVVYRRDHTTGRSEYVAVIRILKCEAERAAGQILYTSEAPSIEVGDSTRDLASFFR